MNDDPIALLEQELVEAVRRHADSHGSRRRSGLGRIGGGLAIAATLAVEFQPVTQSAPPVLGPLTSSA